MEKFACGVYSLHIIRRKMYLEGTFGGIIWIFFYVWGYGVETGGDIGVRHKAKVNLSPATTSAYVDVCMIDCAR